MKLGRWAKLAIVIICVMCMVSKPMCVYAIDAEPGDAASGLEINEEATPEADPTPGAKATPEADPTPGAEATPEADPTPGAEATPEADSTPQAGATPEADVTPKAEATPEPKASPEPKVSPEPVRMLLLGSAPAGNEINIGECPQGIVINSENVSEYDGKTITGSAGPQANLVIDGVSVELTIKDLTIDRAQEGSSNYYCDAINLKNGSTLTLTLEGNNRLIGNNSYGGAGICVEDENTLVITGNSSGTLEAIGGNGRGGAAGIGAGNCGYNNDGQEPANKPALGTIEICGGEIYAKGGVSYEFGDVVLGCAGIGCSGFGDPGKGSITISGGNVTATGGDEGAGIGGATNCSPNMINISGGVISANAGHNAAAIGCGCNGGFETIYCGEISITGGNITANGNIGYGCSPFGGEFEGGSVAIKGNAIVMVTDGEINPRTDIEQGHITQKYQLTVTVMDLSYTTGTATGHITIGNGENAFSQNITYNLGDGKAVANIEIETILYGEQPVKVSIEGTDWEDKTLIIGRETDLIYGNETQDYSVSVTPGVNCRYENGVLTISGNSGNDSVTVSMTDGVELTTDSIIVDDEADVVLTLKNLTVDTTGKNRSPIVIGPNAYCTIIPEGRNTLKRCDSKLAVGVIEASDGSELTIGGYGTLNLQGKTGKNTRGKYDEYAGGIRAINASVIIKDNPTLVISNPEGDAFSGILSENITINGGNINSSVSNTSQGIGIPLDTNIHDVNINGGTIYVEGGDTAWLGAITNCKCARAVIMGGSVNMNKLSDASNIDDLKKYQPVNKNGEKLYCTTITVGKEDDNGKYTLSKNAKVESLTITDEGGSTYEYGIAQMYTDADAKLYLWLPAGSVVSQVKTECGTYNGTCTTNTDCTSNYRGNSFGMAKSTFTLNPESEYILILTGDGTKENPYKLSTLEELEKFRELVNSGETEICGVLTQDINTKAKEWTPIGTEAYPYKGTFDGNGKMVSQLRIPAKDDDYNNKGFFGVVQNAYIKNLNITGSVGENAKTNRNAENYGMIAGKASNSTFEGCINNGSVYGGQNAAGICGWASECTFKKCTNDGNGVKISSYRSVCGIVYDGDNSCTVENCVSCMYSNSVFAKMDSSAAMSNCYTIGGKNRINCLSLVTKYDLYEFMEEDANYYGHKRSDDDNYAGYKADGTKVTENWRDGKIAYLLQGNQKELIWINRLGVYTNEWPQINYTSDDANYRVYAVKKYNKCDKSDTPTVTYKNESGEDIVPTHSFTKADKSSKAVKTPGTCKDKAVYYYSCAHCGAVEKNDAHTFVGDVNPANHTGETEIRDEREAVHKTQTAGYTGDTYCLGCEKKISTGSIIKPTPHEPSNWKYDETYHWKLCTVEDCGIEIAGTKAAHSSTGNNKATCRKVAVCDKCGKEYGEKIPCSFNAKIKCDAALKTPATQTADAVYYYSCSMCGKVEKDDAHTFVDYREPETKPSSDDDSSSNDGRDQLNDLSSNDGRDQLNNLSSNDGWDQLNNLSSNDVRNHADNLLSNDVRNYANNLLANGGQVSANNSSSNSKLSSIDNILDVTSREATAKEDDYILQDFQINNEAIDTTSGNIENATYDKGSSSVPISKTDTVVDKENASNRQPIAVATVVVGSGAVGSGAFFFLKRKRILEKILKKWI